MAESSCEPSYQHFADPRLHKASTDDRRARDRRTGVERSFGCGGKLKHYPIKAQDSHQNWLLIGYSSSFQQPLSYLLRSRRGQQPSH